MTRLAVLSDIHANLPALESVIQDIAGFDVDHVIVAGDTISAGPSSVEVLEKVIEQRWAAIRGNHELYLLHYNTPRYPKEWKDYTLPPYLSAQLKGHWQNVIAAMPDTLTLYFPDAPPVRVVHGSPRSHFEGIHASVADAEVSEMLAGIEENTVIYGHIHLIQERHINGWHLLNPGSVGMPLDGIRKASYMILDGDEEGWTATVRRVPFDLDRLLDEFERQNYIDQTGVAGRLLLEEFRTARTIIIPFYRWHQEQCPDAPLTLALVEEFLKNVNLWDYTRPDYKINMDL